MLWKRPLISGSHRTEIDKSQTQNHIMQVADLQADGIPYLSGCLVLWWKYWLRRKRGVWEDLDEDEDNEFLNSGESSLLIEGASPPPG